MTGPSLLSHIARGLADLGVQPGRRLSGLPGLALPLVAAALRKRHRQPLLVVVNDEGEGLALRDALISLADGDGVLFCPAEDDGQGDPPPGFVAPLERHRASALAHLSEGPPPGIFILSRRLLEQGLPELGVLGRTMLELAPGTIGYGELRTWLEEAAYEPAPLVTEPGTFALRGGIIDLFPVNRPAPLRLDFLGDDLQGLRVFDLHSQISTRSVPSARILPLSDIDTGRQPVTDLYPAGWQMLRQDQEGEVWEVTDNGGMVAAGEIDLEAEVWGRQRPGAELLAEQWRLLIREHPGALAWYATNRPGAYGRARERLPEVPMAQAPLDLPGGFISGPLGCFVLTPVELFGQTPGQATPGRTQSSAAVTVRRHMEHLEPGDPLVHIHHGVGLYGGLTQLAVGEGREECLVLEYAGGDKVYISTEKIGLVFPYTIQEGQHVQVDSLQSRRWERVKQQTRRSAEEVVDELAQRYAAREAAVGIRHAQDDELQAELEASFPYEETADQLQASAEISADMEGPRPMERLLCGDVGFGKTEVALRAAFKAIRGGGQVCLLAPTTILADQHLISFRARLEPFAVNVGLLSRFVPPAQQREVLDRLAAGSIDLVIGTHRLLSKDVRFRNLTLLIVDEEHRFGVRQKERIQSLKANLDVLSLTATPIPRTLHFSLAGIRDISRLDTPPLERIPIMTSVAYYGDDLIIGAVRKELARGGQVYFVHNEVQSIDRVAEELRGLLPDISIAIAHGQMDGRRLERTMLEFSEGGHQLLLCTSIIESGIDLPNVNTVLINNAHKFGLAQIYQIRGRVGRSSRQAYAYLLIRRRPALTRQAAKRLKTIVRYSALGSGYAIALKDLEIRGAGNVFGLEQSGHIAAVGLDLYSRIIKGVMDDRRAAESGLPTALNADEVTVKLFPGAGLPEDYVSDPHLRLNLYRRLASAANTDEVTKLEAEIADRFGPLPDRAVDLVRGAALRILAMQANARSVRLDVRGMLQVDFGRPLDPPALLKTIELSLEPLGLVYRFKNLHSGDLRLLIEQGDMPSAEVARILLNALQLGSAP